MKAKKFISQIGPQNTIKIFNAISGQLHKIINVGGEIISQPICLEDEMYVSVKSGNSNLIKFFNLPGGGLKKIQQC